jgi:predicted dehydrogenase
MNPIESIHSDEAPQGAELSNNKKSSAFSRRTFIGTAAAAWATVSIVPRHVLGGAGRTAPNDKPVLAGIGIGGVGHGQIQSCVEAGFHVGALCDVDSEYGKKTFDRYPDASRYRDFRELLETEGDRIDAIYCGTPDHTHALISLAALKRKKHVLTVKPLTRTVDEGRVLAAASRRAAVMTQMTASPASTESGCRTCELIWDGMAGDIREVHIWSNRPLWPQGIQRPEGADPVPETFDWDLWLGPAPQRPFKADWGSGSLAVGQTNWDHTKSAVYHPWNFRGWYDFGTGALGDMGCHHFNIPRRALKLESPVAVSASSTRVMAETWPLATIVTWEFPAREGMPPVKVVWYDGGLKPSRPAELEDGGELPETGILYFGDKGTLLGEGTSGIPRLVPESKARAYTAPPKTLQRRGGIYSEWIEAVRGGEPPSETWHTDAVPLTEIVLLGNTAIRMGGRRLAYDGENMRFTNSESANELLKAEYHNGWMLD